MILKVSWFEWWKWSFESCERWCKGREGKPEKTYLKGQPRYWPSLPWRFIPCTRRSIVLTSSNIASAVVTGITGAGIVGGSHSLKIWNETWF